MRQGIKRTQRDYSLAFKSAMVAHVEKGELAYKEATGYPNHSVSERYESMNVRVNQWTRDFWIFGCAIEVTSCYIHIVRRSRFRLR